jgi:dipeptidyl-peptidase-4
MKRQIVAGAFLLLGGIAWSQSLPKAEIPIERFFQYPLLSGRSPSSPQMAPNGTKIVFGWNKSGDRKLDLWVMDYPSGEPHQIVEAKSILDFPRQDDERTDLEKKEEILYDGGIAGAKWSPDSKELMFAYKGRTWLVKPDGSELHPLVDGEAAIASPEFSPGGKYISYSNEQNVFRLDRATGAVKQLTFISKAHTSIESAQWSPDGQQIAVVWADNTKLGNHVMMDFSKDRATVVNIRRSWNGELDVNNQIGFIGVDGGLIKFVPDLPTYLWMEGLKWSPDSSHLALSWIQGDDMKYTLSIIPASTAKKADIYTEKAPSNYINDWRPIEWSRDSSKIYLGTDILNNSFGPRSIVEMNSFGGGLKTVYSPGVDVGSFARPKTSDDLIVVTAAPTPLQTEIDLLSGDGKIKKVVDVLPGGYSVPKEFNSSALPLFSDDGREIATVASSRTLNPELYSVEPRVRRLTVSQLPDFQKVPWADFREVTFPGPEGATLHGILVTKPGLDLTKKHPAFLSNIYADSAKASWGGWFENYAAMNLDMVVLCVDFRSSWGYGGAFNSGYYKKLGLIDADEAVDAHNYLAGLPYVRSDRIGIWGWSYGGYLTCMTLLTKPGVFYAGCAVAPVTNWKSYNEWYTRRRLGLIKDDPKLFEKTSPVTYASGLQDHLMLIHGLMDDNVLFQDTAQLIQKLIDNDKYFSLMVYPRDNHSIGRDTSRPHVFGTIMRYLNQELNQP